MNDRAAVSSSRRFATLAIAAALLCTAVSRAQADNMGAGIGAARGAVIGDLVGGGAGAAAGAAIGAMIGAPKTVARNEAHMEQKQAESDARLAQWESERRARELAAAERRAEEERIAALDSEPDLDLLLDTQRALIELGYDPGPIGIPSPELTTAVVKYQESQGLEPNGTLSEEVLERMAASAR